MQVIILGIGKKEGRRSDDEKGNQELDEFMRDCSCDELRATVKENQKKIKQHDEQFKQFGKELDEEFNDLKQLLLLLLPSDKIHMVQHLFDNRKNSALARKSARNDDFLSHNENGIIKHDMNKDNVSYLLNYSFLFLKQCLVFKASLTLMGMREGTFHPLSFWIRFCQLVRLI